MFKKTATSVTRADKPVFTNACICCGLVIVSLPSFQHRGGFFFFFHYYKCQNLFVCSTGDSNEVHGQSHQADEWDPERNKDPEVLCLGESLPGAGLGPQEKGAQSPEEVSDPLFHLHRILQLLFIPGKSTKQNKKNLRFWCEEDDWCIFLTLNHI